MELVNVAQHIFTSKKGCVYIFKVLQQFNFISTHYLMDVSSLFFYALQK